MLLIDADWLCYNTAIAFQYENPFSEKMEHDEYLAVSTLEKRISFFKKELNCSDICLFFSCPRSKNWRRDIFPSYKINRESIPRPIGFDSLKHLLNKCYPLLYIPK